MSDVNEKTVAAASCMRLNKKIYEIINRRQTRASSSSSEVVSDKETKPKTSCKKIKRKNMEDVDGGDDEESSDESKKNKTEDEDGRDNEESSDDESKKKNRDKTEDEDRGDDEESSDDESKKNKNNKIPGTDKFAKVIDFLRRQLHSDSLFVYVNSAFSPNPDESVNDLYNNFGFDGKLVVNYAFSMAWG